MFIIAKCLYSFIDEVKFVFILPDSMCTGIFFSLAHALKLLPVDIVLTGIVQYIICSILPKLLY